MMEFTELNRKDAFIINLNEFLSKLKLRHHQCNHNIINTYLMNSTYLKG